ncbi:hypothetical protein [Anaeromyxobacter sp. SG26]|uniref:hypothetical protein n=1 Tax=Anaeromyxobacter sp. SG26 TaxID=2925407 RepID=UPI001F5AAF4A|nr:hypothetical protein [Anaeromyxobacter sp. SG26]
MTKTERTVALYVAASITGALALALLQAIAGGVLTRALELSEDSIWRGLGVARFGLFKLGLFFAVFGVLWLVLRGESLARRVGAGLLATAVLGWVGKELVFEDRGLAALYVLLGLAATLASAFEAWRRWAAAGVLGLVVAATALASQGDSLVEGRNFFAAIVVGVLFCAPAIAWVTATGEAVDRAGVALDR